MKNKILENIDDPGYLEALYRADKKGFEKAFNEIYPEIAGRSGTDFWKIRLEFDKTSGISARIKKTDVLILIIVCAIT